MRSATTILPDVFNNHDPFPSLVPHPSFPQSSPFSPQFPPMDLQYILSPTILLDDQQEQQQQQQQQRQQVQSQSQSSPSTATQQSQPQSQSPSAHPPLVFQDKHQLGPDPEPVPSSSHVHPNPDDAIISFDSKTRSFPKPTKPSTPTVTDPYAEDFLRDMLGPDKWDTFSTRLFERRLGGKGKGKARQTDDDAADADDPKAGASAVEFLLKVEVVKSILREYVPHPYNPRKSLSHPYPSAPSGHVTLTRSTVLLLCGWSNTQFSYWARRSEAVSVLAEHDSRLRAVRVALERRIRGDHSSQPVDADDGGSADDTDLATAVTITGKGLDTIIEDVKKRTGKSQFLRGKHCSLDPFGTPPQDPAAPPPPPQFAMPTFQAEHYDHSTRRPHLEFRGPPSSRPRPPPVDPPAPPKRHRNPHLGSANSALAVPPLLASSSSSPPTTRATRSSARKAAVAADDNTHHFPVSDSRSEVEQPAGPSKRNFRDNDDDGSARPPTKRARLDREE